MRSLYSSIRRWLKTTICLIAPHWWLVHGSRL